MKKISLLIIILSALTYHSCERDDICAATTPTTPRLLIDLLDVTDSAIKKNVFDLVVVGSDFVTSSRIPANTSVFLPGYSFQDVDDLILPLKTDSNSTEYILIERAVINNNGTPDDTTDDFISGNQDRIIVNYSRKQVFVSRACGFKTVFENITLNIVKDNDNWMLSRQPLTNNQSVEDETTTHFSISH